MGWAGLESMSTSVSVSGRLWFNTMECRQAYIYFFYFYFALFLFFVGLEREWQ